MSLYFWIITLCFIGPFVFSFDKKLAFYKQFLCSFIAIFSIAIPFISWDMYFTNHHVWGFNPDYLSGIYFFNLPVEECLFFIIIPFACLFIHQVLKFHFPKYNGQKLSCFFAFCFLLTGFVSALVYIENRYTATACFSATLLTIFFYFIKKNTWYPNFVFTYFVVLIPFLLVNGILTGAFTEKPIVWYNENHITGFRIFTIPLEDLYYNYDLLLPIVALFEFLNKRYSGV